MAISNQEETAIETTRKTKGVAPSTLPVASLTLGSLSFIGILLSIWMIFFYAPMDAIEGEPQRIFYLHVPMAWIAMLSYCLLAIASVVYLWRKDERWDWVAKASAEIGAVFTTLALITGSLWGRPIWGTWWTWDARLTTTLILWFIYIGYQMLRSYMGRTPASARSAAVLAIIGLVDIPIIHLSVTWWRTLHPQAIVLNGSTPALPPEMLVTLIVSLISFTLLFSFLMLQLYQLEKVQTLAARLRASLE